jgi:hypothetical protein
MAKKKKPPEPVDFAYPAATAATASSKAQQAAQTDWMDVEPEKSPPGKPQVIPPDAQGPPVVAPHAQVYGSRAAIPQQEYVAGQPFPFLSNYLKALPHWVDELTRDFGSDLYERMLWDPMIYSAVNLLKLAVLADGYQVSPMADGKDATKGSEPPPEQKHGHDDGEETQESQYDDSAIQGAETTNAEEGSDYELAKEISDFCHRNLANLEGESFEQFCYEIMAGFELGNKVAEQVYRNGEDEDEGKLVVKSFKVKPREATGYVVDAYMNLVGLLGLIPGQGFPVLVGSIVANPTVLPNLLPREKFVIFTYNMKNNDPRGTSGLRPAYTPWWLKQQMWPEYLVYLANHASPKTVGFTPPDATAMPPTDSLGNPLAVPVGGTQSYQGAQTNVITPEQQMANVLSQLRNTSAAAFPYDAKVMVLQVSGDGQAFRNAIDLFDAQITHAIHYQTLATMEGEHMARASSETHKDILSMPIAYLRNLLALTIRRDVFFNLVRYNYGDEAARRFTPKITFGKADQSDWHVDADSIAKLVTAKFLSPSQFPALDERLNLPPRTDVSLAEQEAQNGLAIAQARGVPDEGGQLNKPEDKNKENSPKDNNQTPPGGKKPPPDIKAKQRGNRTPVGGDSTPFSEEPELLGFSMEEIKSRYKVTETDAIRIKALLRGLSRGIKMMPKRRRETANA